MCTRKSRTTPINSTTTTYTCPPPRPMASSLRTSALLPQCTSCIRRVARHQSGFGVPQSTRSISKKAKEDERNIVVQLLKDVPSYGRAGMLFLAGPRLFPRSGADALSPRRLCSHQSVAHAQPVVPGPRRKLCTHHTDEAAEGQECRHVTRCCLWRTTQLGRGRRGRRGRGRLLGDQEAGAAYRD